MMINNMFTKIMMSLTSSVSVGNNSFILAAVEDQGFGMWLIKTLASFTYLICKWVMYFLDIIFFYIRQLSGLGVDTSSLSSLTSTDGDLFFNLLASNSRVITQIIRQLIGIVFVLIIVVTIIALIKTHYKSMSEGKPGDNVNVIKNTLKSIIMLFITPMIVFGGIAMSNIILKSLTAALNITGSSSISSTIFSLSSTSANQYRLYAQNGKRIPIFFEFTEHENLVGELEDKDLDQKSIDYFVSGDNPGYQAYLMFSDETFYLYDDITASSDYYKTYDQKVQYYSVNDQNRRIRNYQEEYFVMADFIDYTVKTSGQFYFKTIEEVLVNAETVSLQTGQINIYDNMLSRFGISKSGNLITFRNEYFTYDSESSEPGSAKEIEYNHIVGSIDEIEGAIFVVTIEKQIQKYDPVSGETTIYSYYEPVINGMRSRPDVIAFDSPYLRDGSMVIAKGIFTEDGFPTAIRRSQNSTDIQFYRDELEEYDLGSMSKFAMMYTDAEDTGFFKGIVQFFQFLFNPSSLIPKIEVDTDAVKVTYIKTSDQFGALKNGRLHISYLFNRSDSFMISEYNLQLYNFFSLTRLNFLILMMGTWMLLKAVLMVVFGLIKRIYELFILYLFYPTIYVTAPLDDGGGFTKWFAIFTGKLFSAYAIILGVNFVLMVIPIAENIQFFSAAELAGNVTIKRVGSLFFDLMSVNQLANMLNLFVALLFQLVAFSLLSTNSGIVSMMSQFFKGTDDLSTDNSFLIAFERTMKIGAVAKKVGGMVVGGIGFVASIFTKGGAKNLAKRLMPGGAIYRDVMDKFYVVKKRAEEGKAKNELSEALDSKSSSKEEVEKKLKKYLDARTAYTKAIDNSKDADGVGKTTKLRRAERDQKKEEKYKAPESSSSRAENEKQTIPIDEEMMGMTDEELDKIIKNNEGFVKKNEGKADRRKLGKKKAFKYRKADDLLKRALAEKNKRTSRATGKEELKQRIKELEDYQKLRALSNEEKNELDKSKAKLKEYEEQEEAEKDAQELMHDKSRKKAKEKEKEKREQDALLFRHEAKGKYKDKQTDRMNEINNQVADASNNLVLVGLSDLRGKTVEELNAELNKGGIPYKQRKAIEEYRDILEYREKLQKINDQEYANAATRRSEKRRKTQEGLVMNDNKVSKIPLFGRVINAGRRVYNNKSLNINVDEIDAELLETEEKIATLNDSFDEKDIKERRKLVEKREKLKSKKVDAFNWSVNKSAEGKDRLKRTREQEKRFKKADKKHHLSEQAINYLTAKKIPVTQENIDKYLEQINKNRVAAGKKPYF